MPPPKVYILPPTFEYPPNSSIRLGNLLSNPFAPHRPLAILPTESHPPTAATTQTNLSISRTTTRGASASLSAQILGLAGVKAASEFSLSGTTAYSAATVTTRFFESDPPDEAIRALAAANPRAERILFGRRAMGGGKLFMITGVKIAEGFTVSSGNGARKAGTVGADVPLVAVGAPGLSIGAEVGGVRERSEGEAYTVEGEVVIAYRVVVIRKHGRGLELDEYRDKDRERMLRDDDADGGESGEIGADLVEVMDVGVGDVVSGDDDEEETDARQVVLEGEEGEVMILGVGDAVQ
ncbi:hypothetical protein B0T24DRAFT_27653 [Lasiosphaeria ovina]|uniref:Uncharacterized protein n=1 Tax=Lasiosphaeria ovina TaxID=92902 RepID=A0AAE0NK65_9PEZI|nr:hypothetical protein B0T24DRAFT_27653 [Lasiosphaeria ovina]